MCRSLLPMACTHSPYLHPHVRLKLLLQWSTSKGDPDASESPVGIGSACRGPGFHLPGWSRLMLKPGYRRAGSCPDHPPMHIPSYYTSAYQRKHRDLVLYELVRTTEVHNVLFNNRKILQMRNKQQRYQTRFWRKYICSNKSMANSTP